MKAASVIGEDFGTAALKKSLPFRGETHGSILQILKELDYWLEYELPKNLVGIIWKGRYRGQRQKWFIVKYLGKDSEININTKNPEFIEWKWLDIKKLTSVIVDFKKLTPEVLKLLVEKYPDGYDDLNIISFKNASGDTIQAVEVSTEDTKYLVKISAKLEMTMANYDEDDYEDFDDNDPDAIPDIDLEEASED